MARVKNSVTTKARHKKVLKAAKEISENYGLQESMLHVVKMKSVILDSLKD